MAKYRYFTLREFLKSPKAAELGIDNTPTWEVVDNLNALVENILDPLRAAYGRPITVSSGYRCPALNKAVNGANGSAHLRGDAADLQAADPVGFKRFVREWLMKTGTKFDQCILESDGRSEWVHISLKTATGAQRGQLFSMNI